MSARTKDKLLRMLDDKPSMKAAREARIQQYMNQRRQKTALGNLTQGGFLMLKPEVFQAGVEELRELGHQRLEEAQRLRRRG